MKLWCKTAIHVIHLHLWVCTLKSQLGGIVAEPLYQNPALAMIYVRCKFISLYLRRCYQKCPTRSLCFDSLLAKCLARQDLDVKQDNEGYIIIKSQANELCYLCWNLPFRKPISMLIYHSHQAYQIIDICTRYQWHCRQRNDFECEMSMPECVHSKVDGNFSILRRFVENYL